jgi:predicted esterase
MKETAILCAWLLLAGCGAEHDGDTDAAVESAWALPAPCTDTLEQVYLPPSDLSPHDASQRGRLLRCAVDVPLTVSAIAESLQGAGFADVEARSGLRVYRVLYRTERLTGRGGLSAALVLLPERPVVATPPAIVFAHGLAGTASSCAFSRQSLLNARDNEARTAVYLASQGFPVIAPDYAGFLPGEVAAPLSSEDEAHSLLDGTRALRSLLPAGSTSEQVVLVGHSQGGHAVLSAHASAGSYGLAGQLNAVVAFAPWWAANRVFARIIAREAALDTTVNGLQLGFALQYFNGHAELLDGSGAGYALWQPTALAKLAAVGPSCEVNPLPSLGRTTADFLDPAFLDAVGTCGVRGGAACESGLAARWDARFRADRPHLDPRGPVLLTWHGARDALVPPDFSQCAVERIEADLAHTNVEHTACGDPLGEHETVLSRQAAWTAQWIAARTVGGAAPPPCATWNDLSVAVCAQPPGID